VVLPVGPEAVEEATADHEAVDIEAVAVEEGATVHQAASNHAEGKSSYSLHHLTSKYPYVSQSLTVTTTATEAALLPEDAVVDTTLIRQSRGGDWVSLERKGVGDCKILM
jgi:hypothetical protein